MSTCEALFAPYAAFIPAFAAFRAALQHPRACCLRVNTLRATPEAVRALLVSQGYEVTTSCPGWEPAVCYLHIQSSRE